ncbi:hypothetical protein [Ideonella sp.]|uniref:hypothetical protein n=1 Tax=Ideonella sp. TaxID=1929293 RepID=UPI003BB776CA
MTTQTTAPSPVPSTPTAAALAAKAAMESQQIEVFKTGTRTADNGEVHTITTADMRAAAAAYDPALHEAPLVIGHPESDDPAWGGVERLTVTDEGRVLVSVRQVDPAFAEGVKAGRWKQRSVKFYHPDDSANPRPGIWYPCHIGFLGAKPPAVKGLAGIQFAAPATRLVTFSEPTAAGPSHSAATPPQKDKTMTPEEIAAAEKAAREKADADNAALRAQIDGINQAARAARHTANVAFAEAVLNDKAGPKLLPKHKDKLVAVLDTVGEAHLAKPVQFSEAGAEVAFDPVAFIKELVQSGPPKVQFGEFTPAGGHAPRGHDAADLADPVVLDRAINAHMAQHKGVSYAEAALAVCSFSR